MRDALVVVHRLSLGAVVLSALALPVGAILLASREPRGGGNALGDVIAYGLSLGLLVIGGAALILGSGLVILATRSIDRPGGAPRVGSDRSGRRSDGRRRSRC